MAGVRIYIYIAQWLERIGINSKSEDPGFDDPLAGGRRGGGAGGGTVLLSLRANFSTDLIILLVPDPPSCVWHAK